MFDKFDSRLFTVVRRKSGRLLGDETSSVRANKRPQSRQDHVAVRRAAQVEKRS